MSRVLPLSLCLVALLGLAPGAHAAPPKLVDHHEAGLTVPLPEGWKVLVTPDQNNVTASLDVATTLTVYWLPYRWLTADRVLDLLVDIVNKQLPVGKLEEVERGYIEGFADRWSLRRGRVMTGKVDALGYTMKVALAAFVDEADQHIIAGFIISPPESFVDLGAQGVISEVVTGLHWDTDPPLPVPGWWWNRTPPDGLRKSVTP